MSKPTGELVCHYDPDRDGAQVVLRRDGSIRFVDTEVEEKDSVMQADIFRKTSSGLVYKIVMVGRTDTFNVSLKTLRGTQRLVRSSDEESKVFHLICER